MTIHVKINNFRKVQQAAFEISPVAFLVGENENGKSSIAQAVALAAAQQPLPKHIAKKDAKQLVHNNEKSGKIELICGDVSSEISWPLAEFKHTGQGKPLYASEFAVGMKSVFSLAPKDKVAYFISLLKAAPSLDDLKLVLPKSLDPKLPDIWKQIEESGWDEAHATAKEHEAELTGQWKLITGEQRWNVSTAGQWRPQMWEQELERLEKEDLEQAYTDSRKAYEESLKAQGAAQFDRTQAESLVTEKPDLEKQKGELEEKLQAARTWQHEVKKLISSLPSADNDGIPCPECKAKLTYQPSSDLLGKGTLHIAETITAEEKTKRQHDIDAAKADLQKADEDIAAIQVSFSNVLNRLKSVEEAERKLSEQSGNTGSNISASEVEVRETDYKRCGKRLDDFNKVSQAKEVFDHIITQKTLVTALSQDGVRKTKLDEQIKRFNDEILKQLSNQYGSEIVWIDNELNIWRGNYQYHLLSRSARYGVRTILQVAIALADKSELLVIDDVDEINDKRNRGGLLSMVIASGIPALLCMAKRPDENAPDLSIRGDGNTYVVSNGIVKPITETGKKIQTA